MDQGPLSSEPIGHGRGFIVMAVTIRAARTSLPRSITRQRHYELREMMFFPSRGKPLPPWPGDRPPGCPGCISPQPRLRCLHGPLHGLRPGEELGQKIALLLEKPPPDDRRIIVSSTSRETPTPDARASSSGRQRRPGLPREWPRKPAGRDLTRQPVSGSSGPTDKRRTWRRRSCPRKEQVPANFSSSVLPAPGWQWPRQSQRLAHGQKGALIHAARAGRSIHWRGPRLSGSEAAGTPPTVRRVSP